MRRKTSDSLLLLSVFCLAAVAGAPSASAVEVIERTGDWVVDANETFRAKHIRLNGNLILPADAVLTLEDCTLEIIGSHSREHSVEWEGGSLITRNCTMGGYVDQDGVPIHTVFHLYKGSWEAYDTIVQYSYGVSFHWAKGRGVLHGTRLKAGPRPDAIILSGEADVRLIDSDFPIGLGVYVDEGGKTGLELDTKHPVTTTFDASTLLPGVKWRLEMVNTTVKRWFVFVRNIGMHHPPAEITLSHSQDLIVSLLGHNLSGEIVLSNDLARPMRVGNVTLKTADETAGIAMWALYFSGEKNDLDVTGRSHICELMHRGGKLKVSGTPGQNDLSIGCTTLELSGDANMELHHVHLGRPLAWRETPALGEATIAGRAKLTGSHLSVKNVRFHTKDAGEVVLTSVEGHGKIDKRQDGGAVRISSN